MDFSKLVEIFDKHGVTFVSVTQSFNITTSMGRLTLNILLSFAQFEREVIGERIRDKVAASRKKGIWMGGPVPLGYNVKDRKLIVDPDEAEAVRTIFTLYARSSSTAQVVRELDARGILTKTGRPYDKTSLLKTLHNKVYRGLAVHKGTAYPGEHGAIIDETLWDEVQEVIANNRYLRKAAAQEPSPALLRGLIFTETGVAMTPHHTQKGTRRYRYYVSMDVIKKRPKAELRGPQRLPGGMVEDAVVGEIRRLLRTPEVAARVSRTLRKDRPDLGEADISASLTLRNRGGRPRILPPKEIEVAMDRGQDARLLRAIGRAWAWRRRLEHGDVNTIADLAREEAISDRYVSRVIRLAWLSPSVLERLVLRREPTVLSIFDLCGVAELPWAEQPEKVFD